MTRLTAWLGVFFLLQNAWVEPRPDYGLAQPIQNGNEINSAVQLAVTVVDSIDSVAVPSSLSGGAPKLDKTLSVIKLTQSKFSTYAGGIINSYKALQQATDGNIATHFGQLESAIGAALAYLSGNAQADTVNILRGIQYDGIADELYDEFSRLYGGLTDLNTTVQVMQNVLSSAVSANNGNPNVSSSTLNHYFTPAKLYDLMRSINNVKAYLPVIQYTLQTAADNVATADAFIVGMQHVLTHFGPSANQELAQDISAITVEIESKITKRVTVGVVGEVNSIITAVQGMTTLNATTKYNNLLGALSGLAAINKTTADITLAGLFTDIVTSATALINAKVAGYGIITNPAVTALIDTLVGNDEYGQYCYYKYKDLVLGIFDQGTDGLSDCTDKEVLRLSHFLHMIHLIFDLIHFDIEGVVVQVQVCAALSDSATKNDCVTQLNTYYGALFTQTAAKVSLVYTLAKTEAVASKNRLLICIEITYLSVGVSSAADLAQDIGYCAADGPAGQNE